MSQLLELADAYYMVARDLDYHSQHMADTAKFLNGRGDALCELNMRETAPKKPEVSASPQTTVTGAP